jgi:hypothetical protein
VEPSCWTLGDRGCPQLELESKDEAVFRAIGDVLGSVFMPLRTASALHRAVARVPGVTWIPDAVDAAAGRHGLGITHEDSGSAPRSVLIFDEYTLAYTGSQVYFVKGAGGTTGDVLFGTDAVMDRGIVDRRGRCPPRPPAEADPSMGTVPGPGLPRYAGGGTREEPRPEAGPSAGRSAASDLGLPRSGPGSLHPLPSGAFPFLRQPRRRRHPGISAEGTTRHDAPCVRPAV